MISKNILKNYTKYFSRFQKYIDKGISMKPLNKENPGFATRSIHEGYKVGDALGSVNVPIYLTSTYK